MEQYSAPVYAIAGLSSFAVGYALTKSDESVVVDTLIDIGDDGIFTYIYNLEPLVAIFIVLGLCFSLFALMKYINKPRPVVISNSSSHK